MPATVPTVRELRSPDVPAVAQASPSWASIVAALVAASEAGTGTTLIAFENAEPIGLVELVWGESPELRNLHVRPRWRGRGCGTELVRAAEAACAPARSLRLAVGLDNPEARRLYERLGYRSTREQQTITYTYIDASGTEQTATETSEYLTKDLPN